MIIAREELVSLDLAQGWQLQFKERAIASTGNERSVAPSDGIVRKPAVVWCIQKVPHIFFTVSICTISPTVFYGSASCPC